MKGVLDSRVLSEIIYSILEGKNYAQEIATELKKSPSTLVRQLQKLEKNKILISEKEKLLNRTRYKLNWENLGELFAKHHFLGMEHEQKELTKLFQQELFVKMFTDYILNLKIKMKLWKAFDYFIVALPQSNYNLWLKKIPDEKFRLDLQLFIDDCKDFDRKTYFATEIDDSVNSMLSK